MNDQYTAPADYARRAMEKSVEFWKQSMEIVGGQPDWLPTVPQINLQDAVETFFEFIQRLVDGSRDVALGWAQAAGSLSDAPREQAGPVFAPATAQAYTTGQDLQERREHAREQYEGASTADLSAVLVERALPLAGDHDQLVERLAEADTK